MSTAVVGSSALAALDRLLALDTAELVARSRANTSSRPRKPAAPCQVRNCWCHLGRVDADEVVRQVEAAHVIDAAVELAGLSAALDEAFEARLTVPCLGRGEWLSEDPDETRYAVAACQGCPALEACRRAADALQPETGVWAGRDQAAATGARLFMAVTR